MHHQNNINKTTCTKMTLVKSYLKIYEASNLSNDNIFSKNV